ncbi:MAG: hypothetical protein QXN96_03510 [Candidatus Bathyarchaeia archaeon]
MMVGMVAKMSIRTLGTLGFLMGAFGLFLLISPYYFLEQEAYVPKSKPDMGYFLPKYLEAWIILTLAVFLLLSSMILLTFYIRKRQHMHLAQRLLQIKTLTLKNLKVSNVDKNSCKVQFNYFIRLVAVKRR